MPLVSEKIRESKQKKWDKRKRRLERRRNRQPRKKKVQLSPYKAYMLSQKWKTRRKAFFKKYGRNCFVCATPRAVGLHHLSYKHLGKELDGELIALCWTHHQAFHDRHGVKGEMTKETTEFILEQIDQERVPFVV